MRRKMFLALLMVTVAGGLALGARVLVWTPAPVAAQDAPISIANPTYPLMLDREVLTGTIYTDSPNFATNGRDASLTEGYNTGEVLVTISGIDEGEAVTSTVQFSADGENWSDLAYDYWSGSAMLQTIASRYFTEDGTLYSQVTLMGMRLRTKIEATGQVTATVYAT